jgi:sarcosine oxidase gamma subunit
MLGKINRRLRRVLVNACSQNLIINAFRIGQSPLK